MTDVIDQFMWGYQPHFRGNIEFLARQIFEAIGFEGAVEVLLVGLARDGCVVKHQVCIEPEDGKWRLDLFSTLPGAADEAWRTHPNQRMFFGDPVTTREKPERIRRQAISEEVARHLRPDDARRGVRSFCSLATPYEKYHVVTVIQVDASSLDALPLIHYRWQDNNIHTNLALIAIQSLLEQAEAELLRPWPEPGRMLGDSMRLVPDEIVARAARSLMRSPFVQGRSWNQGLFDPIEAVSALCYEGAVGTGRILLAEAEDPNIDYVLRLNEPVPLRNSRWVRKFLQMAGGANALVADHEKVFGLGSISDVSAPPYEIDIVGQSQWDLKRGTKLLMRVRNGAARLAQEPVPADRFEENVRRIFAGISEAALERMRNVMKLLLQLGRGSMIVFAVDAESEARRLERQGTRIQPTAISHELLARASAIDGSIIADPEGVCYAIGVILDGGASNACTAERGSRYNSAVRYVGGAGSGRMAFVVSDDGMFDLVPLLRRQIDRAELERNVAELEAATGENYHAARNFLAAHRFYLSAEQCDRANAALDRIENGPRDDSRLMVISKRFEPDPEMDDHYFLPES